jgi:3-dehydroquinate synthase II
LTDVKKKELIVRPTLSKNALAGLLSKLKEKDITILNADPKEVAGKGFRTLYESEDADMVICKTVEELKNLKSSGKRIGYLKRVLSNTDVEEIEEASKAGANFVIVDAQDWKIIPLENIIAKLYKSETQVFAIAKSLSEVATMFAVLELGVDGVILSSDNEDEIEKAMQHLQIAKFPMKVAKIVQVKDVGTGERVCVDTTSMMSMGEGMLVGSKSNFMLLVHNESVGSSFTSPRPFRVNAGAVYCYTIAPDGKTRYLSELESGSHVWIVNKDGLARKATVGRSKIETRPLRMLRAEIEGETGTVIVQNAETIRLISKDGNPVPVTEIKVGDEVLGYGKPASGRHFGIEVDEYVIEK